MGSGAQFGRQWEHFANARRALMAPHRNGEDQAFVDAFHACHRALTPTFDDSRIDDEEARTSLATVRRLLETPRPAVVNTPRGQLDDYARSLTPEEREEFARAVDVLATYFELQVFCDARSTSAV